MRALLRFLLPQYCLICEQHSCDTICTICRGNIRHFPRHCNRCAKPLTYGHYCGKCLNQPSAIDAFESIYLYNDYIREIVLSAKYSASTPHLNWMAAEMQSYLPKWEADCIIPIPITKKRRLQRGFNQTHYLCQKIAKIRKMNMQKNVLIKKSIPAQSQQSNHLARKQNIKNAFTCKPHDYQSVILIDDVATSGATLQEAAKILKKSGVSWVGAFTFAATPLYR